MIKQTIVDNIQILEIGCDLTLIQIKKLDEYITQSIDNSNIDGTIITGSERCFCTGLDKEQLSSATDVTFFAQFDTLLLTLFSYVKPLIINISGHSVGAGLLIQLCGDYIIADNHPKIRFGFPEFKIGFALDAAMLALCSFYITSEKKMQNLIYNAELWDVNYALQLGMIDQIVKRDNQMYESRCVLHQLLAQGHQTFRINKSLLRKKTKELIERYISENCYNIYQSFLTSALK